jgi:dephospho-CoA kinase
MKTETVVGFAGSGKSTYLSNNFSHGNVIYHDEWAKTFYKCDTARELIKEHTGEPDISKENLVRRLISNQKFYEEYSELGKQSFIDHITDRLRIEHVDAIEVPFLHESFTDLKEQFDVVVVFIKRDVFDCLDTLTYDRGWSKDRINMTIPLQIKNYVKLKHVIDKTIITFPEFKD